MLNSVYCRQLEDKSGFGVFPVNKDGKITVSSLHGGHDKWEKVLGLGTTKKAAWKDYRNRNRTAK